MMPIRVVVVGGGIAGMSAVETLKLAGGDELDVTLLEAKRQLGGRAGSFLDRQSGEAIDYCQHVAMGCCTNLIAFLERAGQRDEWRRDETLTFLHPETSPIRFASSQWLPTPLHLAPALLRLRYFTWGQRAKIAWAMSRLMRVSTRSLEGVLAIEWLRAQRQDSLLVNQFWDVIIVSALGESTKHVSMAAVRKVLIDGFAAARDASHVLVPQRPLAELFGVHMRDYLRSLGVSVREEAGVRRIGAGASMSEQPRVVTSAGVEFAADHVVLATPWHVTAKILGESNLAPEGLEPLESWPSAPISGIHLWVDRRLFAGPHRTVVGLLPQWVFQPDRDGNLDSEANVNATAWYYQVVISAAYDVRGSSKDELVSRVWSDLGKVLPEVARARLLRSKVVTDPSAVYSLTPEVERQRPAASTAIPWLHLGGDWVQTGWPATMEGATIGGRLAANSVLSRLGRQPEVIDPGLKRRGLAKWLIAS